MTLSLARALAPRRAAGRQGRIAARRRHRQGAIRRSADAGYAQEALELGALTLRTFDGVAVEHQGLERMLTFLAGVFVHRHGRLSLNCVCGDKSHWLS